MAGLQPELWPGLRPCYLGLLLATWWHVYPGLLGANLGATLRHRTADLESQCPSPRHFQGPLLSTQMVTPPRAKCHGVDLARQPMTLRSDSLSSHDSSVSCFPL
ncbi:hypothetical protein CsSME_00044202 [Camellia sinensis var. sinensis]